MVSCRPTVSSDSKALTADSSIVFTHEQHQFYYTAGWQIAEELVDENWSEMGPASIDKMFKYVWGVRYIDDIILRRREAEMFGADEETWYHLTDHQFSTVAILDNSANLVERVTYDAYGAARHYWAGDINGDGAVARNDQDMMSASQNKSIGDAEYHVDADMPPGSPPFRIAGPSPGGSSRHSVPGSRCGAPGGRSQPPSSSRPSRSRPTLRKAGCS